MTPKNHSEPCECPNCGLTYRSAKAPGGATIGTWDGPLMLNPCCCVVQQEVLRCG